MLIVHPTYAVIVGGWKICAEGLKRKLLSALGAESLRGGIPIAQVMIAGQEHLREGILRIHTDEIANVIIVGVRNGVSRISRDLPSKGAGDGAVIPFGWAIQHFGCAQLVGHSHKEAKHAPAGSLVCRDSPHAHEVRITTGGGRD